MNQNITEKYQTTIKALEQIVLKASALCGPNFFNAMTMELASALDADYTFVGKLIGDDKNTVRSISLCVDGEIVDNFEYSLPDTPCANVVGNTVCSYPDNVANAFPKDHLLTEMQVKGYVGVPLFDSKQQPLGIVVALYKQALTNRALAEMILQLFASRISNEIERQTMDEQLRNSKAQYQSVVDDMLDYICLFLKDGTITFVNTSLTQLLNTTLIEIIGTCFYNSIIAEAQTDVKQSLSFVTQGKPVYSHEHEMNLPNGDTHWIQWMYRGIYNTQGEFLHFQGVGRDITEYRAAEAEKLKLKEKLHHTEKMLAIGQLAGGVAHDFNNQLAAIVGYTDLLLENLSPNTDWANYAENILIAAKRAADLTTQLLAFARKGKFLSKNVNVHSLIDEVTSVLKHTIDKKITIQKHLECSNPIVNGDPSQLQNALMNIGLNGRDAIHGTGNLIFSTKDVHLDTAYCAALPYEISPGDYVQISVADDGCGIEKEIQERIFEPFFTTKTRGKGLGMGLSAVYGTIKNHVGAININSEPNHGTAVVIHLPKVENPTISNAPVDIAPKQGSAHILLVDDEQMILDVTTKMLTKLGYTVSAYLNGQDAIDFYSQNWKSIDLVIIDMVMPQLSGRELYGKIKETNPNVVALLSSGYSINGEAQEIMNHGVNAFIQKPYRAAVLSQKITLALGNAAK